jgi:hypothetical protein
MQLRATWAPFVAAALILVAVLYTPAGDVGRIVLILAGIGVLAWGFTPQKSG